MLGTVARMFRSQQSARIEALARQVADDSIADVAALVAFRVASMSLSEARGFIRARSAQIVRRSTRLAINRHPAATSDWTAAIIRSATERLIPLVLRHAQVGVPRRREVPAAA